MVDILRFLLLLLPLALSAKVSPKVPKVIKFPEIHITDGLKNNHSRVFGGSYAREGQFPYMVFVLVNLPNGVSRCSAALVSEDLVLLAAHCFPSGSKNPSDIIVVAGKVDLNDYMKERYTYNWNQDVPEWKLNGIQERRGLNIIIHKYYSDQTFVHDLAVLRVGKPFVLSQNVQKIEISTEKLSDLPCTITGWGLTENIIKSYKLVFANHIRTLRVGDGCKHKTEGDFYCLIKGTSGICQGDSGSPLVCDNKVWGVASHFLAYTTAADCGDDEEEYYVDLSQDKEFLQEAMGLSQAPPPPVSEQPKNEPGKGTVLGVNVGLLILVTVFFKLFPSYS